MEQIGDFAGVDYGIFGAFDSDIGGANHRIAIMIGHGEDHALVGLLQKIGLRAVK